MDEELLGLLRELDWIKTLNSELEKKGGVAEEQARELEEMLEVERGKVSRYQEETITKYKASIRF